MTSLQNIAIIGLAIIVSTMTLSSIVRNMLDLKNGYVCKAIIAMVLTEMFVLCNGLTFGFDRYDLLVAVAFALLVSCFC